MDNNTKNEQLEAEPLTFLQLPLEIQIQIIQLVCASDVYGPVFEKISPSHSRPKIIVPVHLLAVCRHFYHNFKPVIRTTWPSRVKFNIESINLKSKEGYCILNTEWGFYTAIKACYPPLIPVTEEDILASEPRIQSKLKKLIKTGTSYISYIRYDRDNTVNSKLEYYKDIKKVIKTSSRFVTSPEHFLANNWQTIKRIDGAPYCKSLQKWRILLPNLRTINYTAVKMVKEDLLEYLPDEYDPFQLSIIHILDGSNDESYAQCAYRWYKENPYLPTWPGKGTGSDQFKGMSINLAHVLSLRRPGPWRHEYGDHNFPANMLVIHVNIMDGLPSVTRKEWRKSDNFIPNLGKEEIPGARFPKWNVDMAGNEVRLSEKERFLLHPSAYRSRWDGRNAMKVAEEIRAEMEVLAEHILLPNRELKLYSIKEIYNRRPGETQLYIPAFEPVEEHEEPSTLYWQLESGLTRLKIGART